MILQNNSYHFGEANTTIKLRHLARYSIFPGNYGFLPSSVICTYFYCLSFAPHHKVWYYRFWFEVTILGERDSYEHETV